MCELPSTCALCGLQLVSAFSLARSYHHLFPVPEFVEVPDATRPAERRRKREMDGLVGTEMVHDTSTVCGACHAALPAPVARYVCPECRMAVCSDCEQLIHEALHSCPGCVGGGGGDTGVAGNLL